MCAVDIGIRHDDDLMITQLRDIEILVDARSERRDDGRELIVADDLVESRLFDVQHFAPQRENRLNRAVTSALGTAACGITLDDVKLGVFGIFIGAVGKLAGQGVAAERRFASRLFSRLSASGYARRQRRHRP